MTKKQQKVTPKLSEAEMDAIDKFGMSISEITQSPEFGEFIRSPETSIMVRAVIGYITVSLKRFSQRYKIDLGFATREAYLIAVGYLLGKRGALDK